MLRVKMSRLPLAATLLAAATVALPAVASGPGYAIGPPPSWVEPLQAELAGAPAAEVRAGQDFLLVDDQVRVPTSGSGVERYHHVVKRILSAKGIETGSELRVDFNPQYQRLTLHGIWIARDGERRQALDHADVRVLQREADLDRRLYDGSLTAVIFLRDVRAGDLVELAYTISGANPVMGGRWAGAFPFGYSTPVGRRAVRLLWPAARPLSAKANGMELQPRVTRRGAFEDRRWERRDLASIPSEGDLPPGVDPEPWLELSEWRGWGEVASWGTALFTAPPPSRAMAAALVRWRALPTPEARALAALRFVQDEVRYLGIELGQGSHRPNPPAEVFARRFGDCKDKSLLLATLLRALGLEATPALVNSEAHGAAADRLPAPGAFDHVIVLARVAGKELWLDPTRSLERAPLAERKPPPFQRALVLAPGEEALRSIPEPSPAFLETVSTYRIRQFGQPVGFEVTTRYEGGRAVWMRHELASRSPKDLEKRYLDHYAHRDEQIRLVAPLRVEDDPQADRLVLHEAYELPGLASGTRRRFDAESIDEELQVPDTARRSLPLRIRHPVRLHEQIRAELPGRPDVVDEDEVVIGPASRLVSRVRIEDHTAVLDFTYETTRAWLPPSEVAQHLEALKKMRKLVGLSIPLQVAAPASAVGRPVAKTLPSSGGKGGGGAAVVFGFFLAGVTLAAIGRRRGWFAGSRRQAFAARQRVERGETAANPAMVTAPEEAVALAARQGCPCGAPLQGAVPTLDQVRLGDRPVDVVRLACGRCGDGRALYFVKG